MNTILVHWDKICAHMQDIHDFPRICCMQFTCSVLVRVYPLTTASRSTEIFFSYTSSEMKKETNEIQSASLQLQVWKLRSPLETNEASMATKLDNERS